MQLNVSYKAATVSTPSFVLCIPTWGFSFTCTQWNTQWRQMCICNEDGSRLRRLNVYKVLYSIAEYATPAPLILQASARSAIELPAASVRARKGKYALSDETTVALRRKTLRNGSSQARQGCCSGVYVWTKTAHRCYAKNTLCTSCSWTCQLAKLFFVLHVHRLIHCLHLPGTFCRVLSKLSFSRTGVISNSFFITPRGAQKGSPWN